MGVIATFVRTCLTFKARATIGVDIAGGSESRFAEIGKLLCRGEPSQPFFSQLSVCSLHEAKTTSLAPVGHVRMSLLLKLIQFFFFSSEIDGLNPHTCSMNISDCMNMLTECSNPDRHGQRPSCRILIANLLRCGRSVRREFCCVSVSVQHSTLFPI